MKVFRRGFLVMLIIFQIIGQLTSKKLETTKTPFIKKSTVAKWKVKTDENVKDIISYKYNDHKQQYELYLDRSAAHKSLLKLKNRPRDMPFNCTYQSIALGLYKKTNIKKKAVEIPVKNGDVLPKSVEAIIATCKSKMNDLLQVKPILFVSPKYQAILKRTQQRHTNVLLFGFNGMTATAFQSVQKEVRGSKSMENFYEIKRYLTISENEYLNLMALLTGYSPNDIDNLNSKQSLPTIFQNYKKEGYVTAFAEDITVIKKFSFEMGEQPADFYLRPLLKAISDSPKLRNQTILTSNLVYDYAEQFMKHYLYSSQPMFGLFWTNASEIEQRKDSFLDYIKRFKQLGLFNESIVIFFNDHICKPMLFIWLPNSFRKRNPKIIQELTKNGNLLTSPFDLYLTLQHILDLERDKNENLSRSLGCPKCHSLFKELPINRSCEETGLKDSNCECGNLIRLPQTDPLNIPLGRYLVKSINKFLLSNHLLNRCEEFTLQKVDSIYRIRTESRTILEKYRIQIIAKPKLTHFFATIQYNPASGNIESASIQTFDRLYRHAIESKCLKEEKLKKFCLCKAKLNNNKPKESSTKNINLLFNKLIKKIEGLRRDLISLKDILAHNPDQQRSAITEPPESQESHENIESSLMMHY